MPVDLGDLRKGINVEWKHKEQREIDGVTYHVSSERYYFSMQHMLTVSATGDWCQLCSGLLP